MNCPFCKSLVHRLEADIAEARQDRDYFRARAERLELLLIPNRQAPVRPSNLAPIGRPSWNDVQAEHNRKLEEEAKAKKESN